MHAKEKLVQFNMGLPIDSSEIPDFEHWVNFNGFSHRHDGYDFAAYLTKTGKVILGLPDKTKIRAAADGVVYSIFKHNWGYEEMVWIKHEKSSYGGLTSGYCHVTPSVEIGTEVKKGDVIGIPWKDSEKEDRGPLVHLHFMIKNSFQSESVDPRYIDESLYKYSMAPPVTVKFTIPELPRSTPFEVAHFKKVDVGTKNGQLFRSKKRIG